MVEELIGKPDDLGVIVPGMPTSRPRRGSLQTAVIPTRIIPVILESALSWSHETRGPHGPAPRWHEETMTMPFKEPAVKVADAAKAAAKGGSWQKLVFATLGPLAIKAVAYIAQNPQVLKDLFDHGKKIYKPGTKSVKGMIATIEALREDVTTFESSQTSVPAETIRQWRTRLDNLARAAQLLEVAGTTGKQKKAVREKLETLRTEIFEALIHEKEQEVRRTNDADV